MLFLEFIDRISVQHHDPCALQLVITIYGKFRKKYVEHILLIFIARGGVWESGVHNRMLPGRTRHHTASMFNV